MRAALALTSAARSRLAGGRHMFIGQALRSGTKPACISDEIARASARAAGSAGHSFAAGNFSARYSRIASDSHTRISPSIKVGTLPVPDTALSRALKSGASSEITSSSKGMVAAFIAIQGRNDQDE